MWLKQNKYNIYVGSWEEWLVILQRLDKKIEIWLNWIEFWMLCFADVDIWICFSEAMGLLEVFSFEIDLEGKWINFRVEEN